MTVSSGYLRYLDMLYPGNGYQTTQQGWDGMFTGRSIPSPTVTDGDNTSASQAPQDSPDMPNDYPQMEG